MKEKQYGPTLPISEQIHSDKYRGKGETFKEAMARIADTLADSPEHFNNFKNILYDMRFLPAGRVQSAIGSPRVVTPYNCFVSGTIKDDMEDIMDKVKESALTMRMGGGIGYGFSTLRPRGALIKSLDSRSSGPVAFMDIYNSTCGTVASTDQRRGAQMGVLRVDHPDIEEFINAKTNEHKLTNFNISVGITDEFMEAVEKDSMFDLKFEGRVYKTVRATQLWNNIMRSTWDWAEPGVLFIDRINNKNNLWYCEDIVATNPCAEQPLPPYGACLLGSINLVKYLVESSTFQFDYEQLIKDIPHIIRAMDNVVDEAIYPLPQQEQEAKNKRRMGIGVTGLANTLEAMGYEYASSGFLKEMEKILKIIRDTAYETSIELAKEKGTFPAFNADLYTQGEFIKTLPLHIRQGITKHGIRNSHLLSIAPTGTISLTADNVSSGIEPVFSKSYIRTIRTDMGTKDELVEDYGVRVLGTEPKTADMVSPMEHVAVLNMASAYVDSACSKTCNIGDDVSFQDFKDVYKEAFKGGSSGCTTFRAAGKRFGILNVEIPTTNEACHIDPETGRKTCE